MRKYVWIAEPRQQRLTHVLFKRVVKLSGRPDRAVLNVFASTNYHLRVNGVTIGYGPARAYPAHPEYDSYDLRSHLKTGRNIIAIDVAHVGVATFHNPYAPGAFIAWGSVRAAAGAIETLDTPGGWACAESPAHDPDPPLFSFAIGPVQLFDERRCPAAWDAPGNGRALRWQAPTVIDGGCFGALTPRSIPHLTQEEREAKLLLAAHAHRTGERIVSFRLVSSYDPHRDVPPKDVAYAWTHVYSPREQQVVVGYWWGENHLNGAKFAAAGDSPGQFTRTNAILPFRQGWNMLFSSYRMVNGLWDMFLGVPEDAGLVFSAERDAAGGAATFSVAGPFSAEAVRALAGGIEPSRPEDIPALAGRSRTVVCPDVPASPCKAVAWRAPGASLALPAWRTRDIVIEPGGASLVFDMGGIQLGRVFVEFTAPAGTVIDAAYAEELRDGRPHLYKMVMMQSGERHIARGGRSRMETFHPRGFRYLEVSVTDHRGPVTIHRAGVVAQQYPYAQRGSFACSDPALTALWEYGLNSLRLCSEDVLTDTPWRERTLYAGDMLVEMAATLAVSGDTRLVKRCMGLFLQSGSPRDGLPGRAPSQSGGGNLGDFALLALVAGEWLCRWTGDKALAAQCCGVADAMMSRLERQRGADGLYAPRSRVFIDHGYASGAGRVCAFNALLCRAFDAWASLLGMAGRRNEASRALRRADALRETVNKRFFDAAAGLYADSIDESGALSGVHTLTANSWALMFGAPRARHTASLLRHFALRMPHHDPLNEREFISAYGSFYYFGGLYEHDAEELAEQHMRIIYSRMLAEPTGTTWEHSHPEKSLSHAWGSSPTYYLTTRALGVRLGFPDAAGPGEILIAPQSGTLTWARGRVPHPQGDVSVEWRIEGDTLFVWYDAPHRAKVTVRPSGRLAHLRLKVAHGAEPRPWAPRVAAAQRLS
ncbi:family 78 glycoside hydrolase catalytic domain [bacterium]|nr:family 78 glycoside hydrolase catalytic domain [bacterium]